MPLRSAWVRRQCKQSPSCRSVATTAVLLALLLLVCAANASAATRFAGPGGTGAAPCSDQAHPCSLFNAASSEAPGPIAQPGDDIVVLPGRYTDVAGDLGPENHVRLPQGVNLHGVAAQPRPLIEMINPNAFTGPALVVTREDAVAHLEISSAVTLTDIQINDGIVEDLIVRSSRGFSLADTVVACRVFQGVLRDSVCLSTGSRGTALATRVFGRAGTFEAHLELRNVTATATGSESAGMLFEVDGEPVAGAPPASLTVHGIGVIASAAGLGQDVTARGLKGAKVEVVLDHSDYFTTDEEIDPLGAGTAFITPAGTGTNIKARALLSADGIHERVESPTIDAGATDGLSGAADIDGQARTLGSNADIGADEFRQETTVVCTPDTLSPGDASNCTATVLDFSTPTATPSGTVRFSSDGSGDFNNGTDTCALAPRGPREASCQITYTPSHAGSGTHTILAGYLPDDSHPISEGLTRVHVLDPTATSVHCTPPAGPVAVGHVSTCTVSVTDTFDSNIPTGKVEFSSDGQGVFSRGGSCALGPQGPREASCQLTYTPAAVGSGSHAITASYEGDPLHRLSSGTATINVTEKSSAAATLSCAPGDLSLTTHDATTCTVTVAGGATTPTGNVSFSSDSDGTNAFSNGASCHLEPTGAKGAACQLTYTPTQVGSGTHRITASYEGDATNLSSQTTTQVRVATAIRYAAPGASGPQPCAVQANPCALFTAAEGSTAKAGDEVVLAPGTYKASAGDLGALNAVGVKDGVTLHGVAGSPRPVIVGDLRPSEPLGPTPVLFVRGAVSHIEVESSLAKIGIETDGGTISDVVSRVGLTEAIACAAPGLSSAQPMIVRNAVCLSSGSGGIALKVSGAGPSKAAALRNLTAVATGNASVGLEAAMNGSGALSVNGIGVIARGTAKDVVARATHSPSGESSHVNVSLAHSDFASTEAVTSDAADSAEVTPAGAGSNVTAAPQFTADGFHQLRSSPTVDAGATDNLSEPTDIDGQPRIMGSAADIGADEVAPGTASALSCTPGDLSLTLHDASTCTVTVAAGATTPTGNVGFASDSEGTNAFSNGASCHLEPSGANEAACQLIYTPTQVGSGVHRITASYEGDATNLSSQATTQIHVATAIRYAAPLASGPEPCAVQANPCALFTATGGSTAKAGDEVVMASGTYKASAGDLGTFNEVGAIEGMTVHGVAGRPRPVIDGDLPPAEFLGPAPVFFVSAGASVSHIEIESSVAKVGISSAGLFAGSLGSYSDVISRVERNAAIACEMGAPANSILLIRNIVCLSRGAAGVGIKNKGFGVSPLTTKLRNVTAVATGTGSIGLEVATTAAGTLFLDGLNVIARGAGKDVVAKAIHNTPSTESSHVNVSLASSDYATTETVAVVGPNTAEITPAGTAGNITAAPQFGGDNFHELGSSPTVDAGAADSLSEPTDIDGQLRTMGAAVDIGADEVPPGITASLDCSPATVAVGRASSCTATVEDNSPLPNVPTGTISFSREGQGTLGNAGACLLVPAGKTNGAARCRVTYTPSEVGTGSHKVTASYEGDASHESAQASASITVLAAQQPSETALSCSPHEVILGRTSTCSVVVTDPAANPLTPSGRVEFSSTGPGVFSSRENVCVLEPIAEAEGQARCQLDYFPVSIGSGTHEIEAAYPGDAAHLLSNDFDEVIVRKVPTSTTLSCNPSRLPARATTSCTATVIDEAQSGTNPSGVVNFTSNGQGAFSPESCEPQEAGGNENEASCQVTYTPASAGSGTHRLTASYEGDEFHAPSEGTTALTVVPRTETNVECAPSSLTLGNPSTCTATVVDLSANPSSLDGGEVSFESGNPEGELTPASCELRGNTTASCSVSYRAKATGNHRIIARFHPDATHEASSGETTIVVEPVVKNDTETKVSCTPGLVIAGNAATCSAEVTDKANATTASTPSGLITFTTDNPEGTFSGGAACELVGSGATAACSVTYRPNVAPADERDQIAASFPGDAKHNSSRDETAIDVGTPPTNETKTEVECDSPVEVGTPSNCIATVIDEASSGKSPQRSYPLHERSRRHL